MQRLFNMSNKQTLLKSKQIAEKQDFKGQNLYFNHKRTNFTILRRKLIYNGHC